MKKDLIFMGQPFVGFSTQQVKMMSNMRLEHQKIHQLSLQLNNFIRAQKPKAREGSGERYSGENAVATERACHTDSQQ